ncbi:hypothetical protein IX51_03410 [uncultured archaeon]|nr:hypothetical protein IX51_03410 [uncultured archaeon]
MEYNISLVVTPLSHIFEFSLKPTAPFDFSLTVKNPAGWSFFTPFEIFENGTLWSATKVSSTLIGVKMWSEGNISNPVVSVQVFSIEELAISHTKFLIDVIKEALGAEQDLSGFYEMARKDDILKHAVDDLYGMHDGIPPSVFPEAVLAILLQMAPLKRSNEMMASFIQNYGEAAEFDDRQVSAWPVPERISSIEESELARKCKVGYRAKHIVKLAKKLSEEKFPSMQQLAEMSPGEARKALIGLPGIGDYSADIISPHGGFPIDVWSAEVFGKLFFGKKPENNREAVEKVKAEGMRRWGEWSWMAFFYVVQDLPNLSRKMGVDLRLT